MNRSLVFKHTILTEYAECFGLLRPETNLAAAFGAGGNQIQNAGDPSA